ncbi:glycosyltransferase [Chryseobacterium indoltheticum]|uniref:Rhamnosyltransferase n=1 Tax=Chryseobacterium indoltheticum TaxID=254 RepID=A0A381F5D6_9FLAO|nr:glycosyltransferase [Chryseobacterium indoltheticum]AZA75218.1 glycosyltransferase [Chryseobacterium indoltheticum]SIR14843.1 rhamnosyltransferase [Chryseobacterium indoltheticum]SUX41707.1 rhamnosyltransferase [Chryseobacterium indoltheticum]
MRLCTIIILYHPEKENLEKSLLSFSKETDYVFCWKNSAINDKCLAVINLYSNIQVLGNEENVGIAKALNECVKIAKFRDFTHILSMDQDSYFDQDMISKYKLKIINVTEKDIAIYGVNPLQDGKTLYENTGDKLNVTDTITSGSIFIIDNFKKYGYFEEELFIDAVDYEYCYRLKKYHNQNTIVFTDIILNHTVGYVEKTKLGFKINNYSAFRTYFIVRNQLSIWRRYPSLFPYKYKVVLLKDHILFRTVKIILAEKNKIIKLKSIFLGILHHVTKKSGYYNINVKKTEK